MPFRIAPFPGQTYPAPYANHHDIRAYLGFGELVTRRIPNVHPMDSQPTHSLKTQKLPLDAKGISVRVPLTDGRETTLFLREGHPSTNGRRGKSSTHRTFAECPDYALLVPAGRTHQHKCK